MEAALFGIVQGLAEFLPISSSGHLYLLNRFMPIGENVLAFFVFLHLATLIAVLIFFAKDIKRLLSDKRILGYAAVVTVVTALVALAVKYIFAAYFGVKNFMAFCFLVNALVVLNARSIKSSRARADFNGRDALLFGIVQGLAAFPGISRSGSTIFCLSRRGFKREEAFSLSFLMGIPVIVLAFFAELPDLIEMHMSVSGLVFGFIAAFLSGWLALVLVKRTVISDKFYCFGYYCLAVFGLLFFMKG